MEKDQSKSSIHKLIDLFKKIREGAAEKEKYSTLLQNLNFFVNFSQLVYENEEGIKLFFKVTHKLTSTPLGETLLVSIQNSTTEFTFCSSHWAFSLQEESGTGARNCSSFKLTQPLGPRGVESVSVPLPLQPFYSISYQLSLIFTVGFNDTHFQRHFPCGRVEVDVLHLLSPVKRLDVPPPASDPSLLLNSKSSKSSPSPMTAPPVVKFEFRANEILRKEFLKIFLRDAAHRGFSSQLLHIQQPVPPAAEFVTFVGSEEVRLEIGLNRIVLRTFSSPLLAALKKGLLSRLQKLEGLRVKCPGDAHLEELYRLKLKLSSNLEVTGTGGEEGTVESELQESYLLLTNVTEGLEFSLEVPLPPVNLT